jgi:hypothetical protein
MGTILFFTFLTALAKSGLLISLGVLIRSHLDTVLSLIIRKPIPEDLISAERLSAASQVIRWIGFFIIALGIGLSIVSFSTMVVGMGMPSNVVNFRF